MDFLNKNFFANLSRLMVSNLQPWDIPSTEMNWQAKNKHYYAISNFSEKNEALFWQEQQNTTLGTLKLALLLGVIGITAFIILDLFTNKFSSLALGCRLLLGTLFSIALIRIHTHAFAASQIANTAKFGVGISILNMAVTLLAGGNTLVYAELWTDLLPVYFFIYGQLFMTIADAVLFGWLAMLTPPVLALCSGFELTAVYPSILILSLVNVFGFCTRYHLEIQSRKEFLSRRNAEMLIQEKNLFYQHISHNLRQPLQALSCYISVMDAACNQQTTNNIQHLVDKLGYSIDELINTCNHILQIANLESGKQAAHLVPNDINLLLSALETQYAPLAAKHGLIFKVELRNKPPYCVNTDLCILSQIIGNLIDNAIKYTRNGWILVKTVKVDAKRLKLYVIDTGIGITEEQKDNIFKEFYRGSHRREGLPIQGLGLGLAYVKKALENLPGHELHFYSKASRGSDFQLIIPLSEQVRQPREKQRKIGDLNGSFIFLVDDDQQVLQALAEQLSSWGALVQTAADKTETLAMLAENIREPDLLITDFYLANQETAHDIIAVMQAKYGSVPTLILSAHAIADADKALWPENTLLLRKPASNNVLLETITRAIGSTE